MSYGYFGEVFDFISSFLSNRQLQVVLDGKSSQEYTVNAGVPQGYILGLTLFLSDKLICNIANYAYDTIFYSKCDQASDLWQQLELASELESHLRDTTDWGRNWLVDFNARKTRLILYDQSNNSVAIDAKMGGSVLKEKSSFKTLELSKLGWGSYIVSIAKTASTKIGAFIHFMKFLNPKLLFISINLAWNKKKQKNFMAPFLWMGFNCLKARATSRRQFTFYH